LNFRLVFNNVCLYAIALDTFNCNLAVDKRLE